jgi:hypothetical protein
MYSAVMPTTNNIYQADGKKTNELPRDGDAKADHQRMCGVYKQLWGRNQYEKKEYRKQDVPVMKKEIANLYHNRVNVQVILQLLIRQSYTI